MPFHFPCISLMSNDLINIVGVIPHESTQFFFFRTKTDSHIQENLRVSKKGRGLMPFSNLLMSTNSRQVVNKMTCFSKLHVNLGWNSPGNYEMKE